MFPEYSRLEINRYMTTVCRFVVEVMDLTNVSQVTESVFELTYEYLWFSDELKFAVESFLDGDKVIACLQGLILDREEQEDGEEEF